MGALLGLDTGREELLPARCLVGRSRACDLILAARDVSSQHAVVQWTGAVWELQDLGSRNGTAVGEHRLAFGERVPLRRGHQIRFGRQSGAFEFVDDAPPRPMAVHLDSGRIRVAAAGLLALPDDDPPELLLYPDGPDRWIGERHGELSEVGDRAVVLVRGEMWRVHLPTGGPGTWEEHSSDVTVADLLLRFSHSSNEEYVELVAFVGERRLDLQARAHHYPLLLLARARGRSAARRARGGAGLGAAGPAAGDAEDRAGAPQHQHPSQPLAARPGGRRRRGEAGRTAQGHEAAAARRVSDRDRPGVTPRSP
ncbi:FHA domain-containing protein [Nannocystis pusilla]|uniref:FHA domain-containing protein n=1 Tax=Nannocystis pusilla TaxID=889268 RepID=UPI003B76B1F6